MKKEILILMVVFLIAGLMTSVIAVGNQVKNKSNSEGDEDGETVYDVSCDTNTDCKLGVPSKLVECLACDSYGCNFYEVSDRLVVAINKDWEPNCTFKTESGVCLQCSGGISGDDYVAKCIDKVCIKKIADNQNDFNKSNQGLGQIIRNRVKAGVYTNEEGGEIRVSEMAQNRIKIKVNDTEVETELEIENEEENNKTKLKVKLSNGRNAEIKIMPNTASERALERLRLKVCSEENNCKLELKEVGKGEETELAYELKAEKQGRFLGIFKMKMKVQSQVNAENGDVIKVKKPWWAFLVAE